MMTTIEHCGLFFTREHIEAARRERDREPLREAWAYLAQREQTGLQAAQWWGLRALFSDDRAAGAQAVDLVRDCIDDDLISGRSFLEAVMSAVTLAQAFEMTRDHDAWAPLERQQWLDKFAATVSLIDASAQKDTPTEQLWMALLQLVSAIVLEQGAPFETAVTIFRRFIEDEVRPQGFVTSAVATKDGGTLYRQVLAAQALVLMAEAAAHVGVDLWEYHVRGVSAMTAAMYPIYYFYTPEKWAWEPRLTVERTQAVFHRYGGFLEIMNRRTRHRDLKPLLEDLRPIYDPVSGGLVTLTHGLPAKRGLFG